MPLTVSDREHLDTLRSIMRMVENGNNVGQVLASFSRYIRDNIDRAGDRDLFAEVCDICGEGRSREVEHIMTEYVRIRDIHEPVFNQIYSRAEWRETVSERVATCENYEVLLEQLRNYTFTTQNGLVDGRLPGYYFDRMRRLFSVGRTITDDRVVFEGREVEDLRDEYYRSLPSENRYTNTQFTNLVLDNSAGQYVLLGPYGQEVHRFTSLEEARAYMNRGANEENRERISETRPRAALRRLSNAVTNALSPGQVSDLRPTPPQHVNARNAQENLTRAREIFSTQMSNQYLEQFHRDLAELLDRYSLEDVRSVVLRSGELPYREYVLEMRRGQGIRQEPLPKPGILAWQRRLNKIVLCRVQEDPTLDADAKTMQAIEGQEMLFRVQSRAVGRNRTELVLVPVFKDHEATGLLLAYLEVTDVVFIREVEQEEFEGILDERRKEAKRSRRRIDFED